MDLLESGSSLKYCDQYICSSNNILPKPHTHRSCCTSLIITHSLNNNTTTMCVSHQMLPAHVTLPQCLHANDMEANDHTSKINDIYFVLCR